MCCIIPRHWDDPGPRFNINMPSYQYRKSHCGDKTILRPSYPKMGFPILVRRHIYIESGPRWLTFLVLVLYIRDLILIIAVPANVLTPLAPNGANPTADTVLTKMSDKISPPFPWLLLILHLGWPDDVIQNGRRDLKCYNSQMIQHVQNQYHSCWCPRSLCRQAISRHDIDLILPEYSVFSTKKG